MSDASTPPPPKPTPESPGLMVWVRSLVAALSGAAVFWGLVRWYGFEGLFADAYSHVIYWHETLAGTAGTLSPTVTTPKPLAVVVTGLAWDVGGGAGGVLVAWSLLGGLALGFVWLVGERLYGAIGSSDVPLSGSRWLGPAAGLLAMLLAARWMMRVPLVFEARTALLAAVPLLWALERTLARGRPGAAAGVGLLLAGLVRPEAWVLAALWLLVALLSRARHGTPPSLTLAGPLVALAAPVVWMAWDLTVFGDAFFSRHATAQWQALLRPAAPQVGLSDVTRPLALWSWKAVERFGTGFAVMAPAGLWLARARGRRGVAFLPVAALVWVATVIALGLLGYTSSHRFVDPVMVACWPLAGGVLASALFLVPRQAGPGRALVLLALIILVAASAAGELRDRHATARRLNQPTAAIEARIGGLITSRPDLAEGRWLVDNDVASRLALQTPLARAHLRTLQAAGAEEIERGPWAGLVIDDRLQPRRRGTPQDRAIAALAARGRVQYQAGACVLVTLGE